MVSSRGDNETEVSRRVKTEFLVQMQGVSNAKSNDILVLGATNLPWVLDGGMRRRFEKRVYIALPDFEGRLYLLKNRMKKELHTLKEEDFEELARKTDMYSGSDLNTLIKNACYEPLRTFQAATHFKIVSKGNGKTGWMACDPNDPSAEKKSIESIKADDVIRTPVDFNAFLKALNNTKPTVGKEELNKFEQWTKDFGMDG